MERIAQPYLEIVQVVWHTAIPVTKVRHDYDFRLTLLGIVHLAIIERRCCWWACGASNTVGMYNGMETYFCVGDECNGYGAESALSPPGRKKS